jgi:hypothetical protein
MQKQRTFFVLLVSVLVLVAGCAPVPNSPGATPAPSGQINLPAVSFQINTPGPNPLVLKPNATGQVAGVLLGLWHGIIAPVTMVLSFFNPNVQMYEVHNDGSQYNLGFLLGVAIFFVVLGALLGSRRH